MRKIVEYMIVTAYVSENGGGDEELAIITLEQSVRGAMSQGWEPMGGVSIFDNDMFTQTMVKYADQ
jgi:hypothetical protein